jgi:hypothetical protein
MLLLPSSCIKIVYHTPNNNSFASAPFFNFFLHSTHACCPPTPTFNLRRHWQCACLRGQTVLRRFQKKGRLLKRVIALHPCSLLAALLPPLRMRSPLPQVCTPFYHAHVFLKSDPCYAEVLPSFGFDSSAVQLPAVPNLNPVKDTAASRLASTLDARASDDSGTFFASAASTF